VFTNHIRFKESRSSKALSTRMRIQPGSLLLAIATT